MDLVRERIRVEGVVQGVGFRPFVYSLAARSGLAGLVGNDTRGVFIEVEGSPAAIADFRSALATDAPPLAVIEQVSSAGMDPTGEDGFVIAPSRDEGRRQTLISADTATCADCLTELFDPADRRYRYPFINCTNCGPRFTIVRDVPYDRPYTTMAGFSLCPSCAAGYHDPGDRRFHAQPVCCPDCGPSLRLCEPGGSPLEADPIAGAAAALRAGQVVAVKGLGGYHLAAEAASATGVGALRDRKHREDKAFAVMVGDVAAARTLCQVDEVEERVLTSFRRPIVLLRRRPDAPVADSVAPGNRFLGVMLPYTPVHHLLCRELASPFVLTSGNVSDEPIAYEDEDAFERLGTVADVFLTHDRPIQTRTDDSVVRVAAGREMPVRRSRGYVPEPLTLPVTLRRPALACGAELKNTFCLAAGNRAFVSQHIGDLENYETLRSFTQGIAHLQRLFTIGPELVAHDLHPEYLSTKHALELEGVDLCGVQHHHAHIASCLADNGEQGPAIGVAFDGLGYGTDGAMWGGEFLIADLAGFERAGHLEYVAMPGGAAAVREPWRMSAAYLDVAFGDEPPVGMEVARRNRDRWERVRAAYRAGANAPLTSSVGRLFDAVAAILGVRDRITYEGQAAVELELLADPAEAGAYQAEIVSVCSAGSRGSTSCGPGAPGPSATVPFLVRAADLVRAVAEDHRAGVDPGLVAGRFQGGVAAMIVAGCLRARQAWGLDTVALSGGVFQNQLLLAATLRSLETEGFRVLVHGRVPTNDGGISFGQAAVAAARDRTD